MRPLLIVNPSSGGGRTGALFEKMRSPIERALGPVDVVFTERGRHAVDLARDAAIEGRETVIAVGGDGSINEVTNGLMQAREKGAAQARLGIIGQGTGGDFRKSIGLKHRLDHYLEVIATGRERAIDVGRASFKSHEDEDTSAYFMNILSMGIGGLVDKYVASMGRALGGTFTYFAASVRGVLNSEVGVLACSMTLDGETREIELRSRTLAVCNGRYFGSGMEVAPMGVPDDGTFDVINLGSAPRLKFFLSSSKMYTGSHIKSADVQCFRCQRIEVRLRNESISDRFLLDVDGEPLGKLPITIEIIPKAIKVLVPSS
jgi:YegS/Rv2252/BmrU family lipid kinase